MVFAKEPFNPSLYLRGENMDDCAQFLEYVDVITEMANKIPAKSQMHQMQGGMTLEGKNNQQK